MRAFPLYPAATETSTLFGLDMTTLFVIVTVIIVLLCLLLIPWIRDFRDELKYINMEIGRTDGRERAHWEKKKKKLWLSLIPFFPYK